MKSPSPNKSSKGHRVVEEAMKTMDDFHKKQKAYWEKERVSETPTSSTKPSHKTVRSTGLSNCCKAEVSIFTGHEGTSFYYCAVCLKACDLWSGDNVNKRNKNVNKNVNKPSHKTNWISPAMVNSGKGYELTGGYFSDSTKTNWKSILP